MSSISHLNMTPLFLVAIITFTCMGLCVIRYIGIDYRNPYRHATRLPIFKSRSSAFTTLYFYTQSDYEWYEKLMMHTPLTESEHANRGVP